MSPGETSYVEVHVHMHPGMGGPHHFVINVASNDPVAPTQQVAIKMDFLE